MNNWILLMVIDAFVISFSEVFKKKALSKSSIYEIPAFFTLIAFFINLFFSKDALNIYYIYLPIILIKSIIIVGAWLITIKAIKELQLSLYGVLKISRIVFTVLLSCLFLGETFTLITFIGLLIVIVGLVLVNITDMENQKKNNSKIIVLFLISCIGSALSAIIDKKILVHITTSQLQFWFYLFLTILFFIALIIKEKKIDISSIKNNYWIPLIAICMAMSDRLLFIANSIQSSKVIVMIVLKQLSVVVSIILGKLIFKEKNILKKILYSILIIVGVVMMSAF